MHGMDHPYAAVQTRDGPNRNYRRYPASVSPQSQSSSPFSPHAPACHDAQTALHHIHTGRRGCMLTHSDRHLPYTQRPYTHCYSPNTLSLTHTSCLTHTHHTTHTRGGTHPRCFIYTPCLAHACRFRLRCPFNTRRAGKHALRHTRKPTTHTRGLTRTRGLIQTRGRTHTRGSSHTTPFTRAMRALQHAFRHARVHTPRHHTHRDIHAGDSRHL